MSWSHGTWSELDRDTGEVQQVQLPPELAHLVDRAMNTAPRTSRTRPRYNVNRRLALHEHTNPRRPRE